MSKQAVLMFHGIGDPPADIPKAEVPYWITTAFFREIVAYVRDRPNVVLTFDDGNTSDLQAGEELAAAGLHGKFYVLTGRFGRRGYLDPAGLRTLDEGGMEVGLHGTHHVDWRKIDSDELDDETITSRRKIEDAIRKKVTSAAIPFGAYNRTVMRHLRRQPFDRVYTSDRGLACSEDRFLRRNPVMGWQTLGDIKDMIADRASVPARLRRTIMPIIKRNIG